MQPFLLPNPGTMLLLSHLMSNINPRDSIPTLLGHVIYVKFLGTAALPPLIADWRKYLLYIRPHILALLGSLVLVYVSGTKCCWREGGRKDCQCRVGLFPNRTQIVGNSNKLAYLSSQITTLYNTNIVLLQTNLSPLYKYTQNFQKVLQCFE